MKLIIGTYRQKAYISRALQSIDKNLTGHTETIFVDDSGNPQHSDWLRQYGEVIEVGGKGYGAAMTLVCEAAKGEDAMFFEEDFTLLEPVDLADMSGLLHDRPYLAQIALLRQPWFDVEHEHGGLLEALAAQGHDIHLVNGVWEQEATFTCNPAVWRGQVFAQGWPIRKWSEEAKRDQLLRDGWRFGFMEGVKVNHDGERTGSGY